MRVKSPSLGLIMAGLISVTTGCVVGPHTKSAQAEKAPTSIHQQVPTASAANLTLATWNMEHLAFPISQGCRPRSETRNTATATICPDSRCRYLCCARSGITGSAATGIPCRSMANLYFR